MTDKKQNTKELHLATLLTERGLEFKTQVPGLVPGRKFVVDFLLPRIPAVIELQGGVWGGPSGHNTGKGIERDCEKSNLLQIEGYMVYKIPTSWLGGQKYELLKTLLDFLVFFEQNAKQRFKSL